METKEQQDTLQIAPQEPTEHLFAVSRYLWSRLLFRPVLNRPNTFVRWWDVVVILSEVTYKFHVDSSAETYGLLLSECRQFAIEHTRNNVFTAYLPGTNPGKGNAVVLMCVSDDIPF